MGGLKLKGRCSGFLFLIVVMSINYLTEVPVGASASITNPTMSCNGTAGDCFFVNVNDEDEAIEEFQKHFVGGRWLLQAQDSHIANRALQPPPTCNTPQYSNCIVTISEAKDRCTDYNKCKRAG